MRHNGIQSEKKIDLGVGYSTDTGVRGEALFTHYNTLRPGWQGSTKLRLDAKEQTFNGELALTPETSGWRNRLDAEALHSDIENLITRRYGVTAQRAWRSPEKEHDWALKFQVENWRWAGVPFFLRTGKRLPKRVSEIAIQFRHVPLMLFDNGPLSDIDPNVLAMKIQPDEGISLRFSSKAPGQSNQRRPP